MTQTNTPTKQLHGTNIIYPLQTLWWFKKWQQYDSIPVQNIFNINYYFICYHSVNGVKTCLKPQWYHTAEWQGLLSPRTLGTWISCADQRTQQTDPFFPTKLWKQEKKSTKITLKFKKLKFRIPQYTLSHYTTYSIFCSTTDFCLYFCS